MRYILLAFVFYLLYKLIFDFVIPVSRATSQVRSKIKEMQHMQEQQFGQQQSHTQSSAAQSSADNTGSASSASGTSGKEGDYIDFEEIK